MQILDSATVLRGSRRCLLAAMFVLWSSGAVLAENVDPAGNGSQYAWGEIVGWLNAEPQGEGGPGIQVGDSGLTGWMWAENAGWISLSCTNTSSCATKDYGVANNGCGILSGYAWSENAGWINFAPATCTDPTCGVKIDSATGIFSGRAWSENAGWITFSSTGPNPYQVVTSWRGITAPPETQGLRVAADKTTYSWNSATFATQYDVLRGSLGAFPVGPGGADEVCFDNLSGPALSDAAIPAVGSGFWYLSRGANACVNGSFGTQGNHGAPGAPRTTTTCP